MSIVKTYVVDIDGTICRTNKGDYENAVPYKKRIQKLNSLYDDGDKIIYFTARGSLTDTNWMELTMKQLTLWGAKHNDLIFYKPYGDYYIDDRNLLINEFFK